MKGKEKPDTTKVHASYLKLLIMESFEFGTFLNLEDFGKAKVLQMGLGGGGLNTVFSHKFPEVGYMNFYFVMITFRWN